MNDVDGLSALASSLGETVTLLNRIAERFAPSFAMEGAEGSTTGIGNFLPEPVRELHEAIEAENWQRTKEIQNLLQPFEELRDEPRSPPFTLRRTSLPLNSGWSYRGCTAARSGNRSCNCPGKTRNASGRISTA